MGQIARWTTPAISYKPEKVTSDAVAAIKCVLTQNGVDLVIKTLDDATIVDGRFIWVLTQQESASLSLLRKTYLQFDYLTNMGMRYTTVPREYGMTNSATDEAM